ncbi:MAG TPA: hypothetical protein VMZ91_11030 [Candidatus Paceibacterota bacterium]|nr:hypothetical protein [Candidatus Paceibacterota bacterium]
MKIGGALSVFSQIINFMIFIYFIVVLLKINALDVSGLLISAFGLMASLISNIVSTIETRVNGEKNV